MNNKEYSKIIDMVFDLLSRNLSINEFIKTLEEMQDLK